MLCAVRPGFLGDGLQGGDVPGQDAAAGVAEVEPGAWPLADVALADLDVVVLGQGGDLFGQCRVGELYRVADEPELGPFGRGDRRTRTSASTLVLAKRASYRLPTNWTSPISTSK